MTLRYLARDLSRSKRQAFLFVLNIAFGLFGLALLESFRQGLDEEMGSRSRQEAGGDLVVTSRVGIEAATLAAVDRVIQANGASFERARSRELFTMASSAAISRLAMLRVQDSRLPFYGETIPGSDLDQGAKVWVEAEILSQFQIRIGETLMLGSRAFVVSRVVDPKGGSRGMRASIAPVIYMGEKNLDALGLLQKGSTMTEQWIYRVTPDTQLASIVRDAKRAVTDPSIRIESHEEVSESNARAIRYLSDYLGLVALVALTLAMTGLVYLLRAHIASRMRDYAVLKMLGVRARTLWGMLLAQSTLLALGGVVIALAACVPTFWILQDRVESWTGLPIRLALRPGVSLLLLCVGVFASIACTVPFLRSVAIVPARRLFSESGFGSIDVLDRRWIAWTPAAIGFAMLSVWQAHSLWTAGFFVAWLGACAVLLGALAWTWLRLISAWSKDRSFEARHVVLRRARNRPESFLVFVVIAFGALLVSLIATLERALQDEFDPGRAGSQASLFLFDIQDEQLPLLEDTVRQQGGSLDAPSPLIRARMVRVNEKPFERDEETSLRSRDDETRERSRSRTYNLTERAVLSTSESVTQGRYVEGRYDPASGRPAEVSLDEGFARRVGLKVGDLLTFDVLGVPVEGRVVGLRRVRWASFQPNFFIQFQPGVFDGAPKTHLASISGLGSAEVATYSRILAKRFPNVSVIDIRRVVERILDYTRIMATALRTMAWLVFLSAAIVLLCVQSYHATIQRDQDRLLARLGLVRARIARMGVLDVVLWLSPAVAMGFALNLGAAIPILRWLLNVPPALSAGALIVFAFIPFMLLLQAIRSWVGQEAR